MRNPQSISLFFTFILWLGTTTGFQPSLPVPSALSAATGSTRRTITLLSSQSPNPFGEDDSFGGLGGMSDQQPRQDEAAPAAATAPGKEQQGGIGMPKMPEAPSFGDQAKGVFKRFGALAATIFAFVVIQKVGLQLSETFTPELSAEDIANYSKY